MVTFDSLLDALTLISALGCGLIAGVFFAFSAFVMRALSRLPPAEGIAAMQSVNIAVIHPVFLSVFLGTAVLCVILILASFWRWQETDSIYRLVGGALYLVGTFVVTMLFNIPRNNALAVARSTDPATASLWSRYLKEWTAWNHVRTAAAFAATIVLIWAFCR